MQTMSCEPHTNKVLEAQLLWAHMGCSSTSAPVHTALKLTLVKAGEVQGPPPKEGGARTPPPKKGGCKDPPPRKKKRPAHPPPFPCR